MKFFRPLAVVTALGATLSLFAGCDGQTAPTISLQYSRQAEHIIPADVKRLAIARFTGKSEQDTKWADIAADKLASALDEAGRYERRYEVMERKRLKELIDENDIQSISGDAEASQLGKLLGADAVIYGTLIVSTGQKRVKQIFGIRRSQRFTMVTIAFHMVEVTTAKRLVSVSINREHDPSQAPSGGRHKDLMGLIMPRDELPQDKILDDLVTQCSDRFVAMIAPHKVKVMVQLEVGEETKLVDAGNKLAKSGEYAAALEYYSLAISRDSHDYGAIFDAGVMYEAQRQFDKAADMYKRAFDLGVAQKFADAWNRVRQEKSDIEQ